MKAPRQLCKPTDRNIELGCNKMQRLKPSKHTNKLSGNSRANCKREGGQLYARKQTVLMDDSFIEAPFGNSENLAAQPPKHSKKIKVQFFQIEEAIQEVLRQEERNPYLELILAPRKMCSIVQHLNTKWGSSRCAKGELMLFPDDARLDNVASYEKWTLNDSCTTADLFVAVGSPNTFRLTFSFLRINSYSNTLTLLLKPPIAQDSIPDM